MALRRRGKDNFYHAYFRKVITLPDGSLQYTSTTVNLGTDDLATARAMEAELMAKNKAARLHQRALSHLRRLEVEAGARPESDAPAPISHAIRRKRLKLAEWQEAAAKYRDLSRDTIKIFNRFVKSISERYFDEITPERALRYLNENFGDDGKGKSFNNNKSVLNTVFRLLRIDAGIESSPFERIPNRKHVAEHQRPFTEEEFLRIYHAAAEPWKTAVLIAWWTGLRQESVFNLKWSAIEGDVLTTMPGKTARFGRAVRIPIHPQLLAALSALPRKNEYVLGCFKFCRTSNSFHRAFGELLDKLGIVADERGIVNFNCLRDSFVTRCDEAGIPRHATRGIVGHVSDKQTDLYSHDLNSARQIQHMKPVNLDKPDQI